MSQFNHFRKIQYGQQKEKTKVIPAISAVCSKEDMHCVDDFYKNLGVHKKSLRMVLRRKHIWWTCNFVPTLFLKDQSLSSITANSTAVGK
jgi:hypothetical protein